MLSHGIFATLQYNIIIIICFFVIALRVCIFMRYLPANGDFRALE